MKQCQRKPGLEFHEHRVFFTPTGHHIRIANLALHLIALGFQQSFDGGIKIGFRGFGHEAI